MNIENTIKKDLEQTGIAPVIYARYLGLSRQAVHKRLQREETKEERAGFDAFLKSRGITLIDPSNKEKEAEVG